MSLMPLPDDTDVQLRRLETMILHPPPQAQAELERLLRESQEAGARPQSCRALRLLSLLASYSGQYPEARARALEAFELAQTLGEQQGRTLVALGLSAIGLGEPGEALWLFLKAAEEIADPPGRASALLCAALAYQSVGEIERAQQTLEEAGKLRGVAPEFAGSAQAQLWLAQGKQREAADLAAQVAAQFQAKGWDGLAARLRAAGAVAAWHAGDPQAAAEQAKLALAEAEGVRKKLPQGLAQRVRTEALQAWAELCLLRQDAAEALGALHEAWELHAPGDLLGRARTLQLLSQAAEAAGDLPQALEAARQQSGLLSQSRQLSAAITAGEQLQARQLQRKVEAALSQNQELAVANRALTESREALAYQASRDPLTGLLNRSAFHREAQAALSLPHGPGTTAALLFLDIDNFKAVNEEQGQVAADKILTLIAERLRDVAGPDVLLARIGGDEFMALAEGSGEEHFEELAAGLVQAIQTPLPWQEKRLTLTASLGYAVAPEDGLTFERLQYSAHLAMRSVKQIGGPACSGFTTPWPTNISAAGS
ncbi:GGDEF domain-containing protein [Deinococcus lacus]|uniref:GGDEF domain-containing protein n=1 Tax=Deinococcus lacus TaxID=392561 RepID=A0ABW1YI33_9DEIO